jgi:hypothetical protein
MNANPDTTEEPSVVGVRVRPSWSIALYALLVLSAGLALYAQRAPETLDPALLRAAPWLFLVFAAGFSVYRVALVVARRYSPFKAFIQIFLAALFFLLLLFPREQLPGERSLLAHPDARVRALAAEVAGYRGEAAQPLVKLLSDPSPEVRQAAHDALVKLNGGTDLGAAAEAWEKRFP